MEEDGRDHHNCFSDLINQVSDLDDTKTVELRHYGSGGFVCISNLWYRLFHKYKQKFADKTGVY